MAKKEQAKETYEEAVDLDHTVSPEPSHSAVVADGPQSEEDLKAEETDTMDPDRAAIFG